MYQCRQPKAENLTLSVKRKWKTRARVTPAPIRI